jgi:hypothetical protein
MKRISKITSGLLVIAFALLGCAQQPYDPSWITLIDGETGLDNFNRVGDANWRAEEGAIVADKGNSKASSHLLSKNSYRDFQMRVEFWASSDANSGIFIRITNPKKITAVDAYEVNIYDRRPAGLNYGTGGIPNYAPLVHAPKAGGKWNTYEITAKGSHLVVVLNGEKTVDTYNSANPAGPFSLQWGGGVVKWRKLQIKPI